MQFDEGPGESWRTTCLLLLLLPLPAAQGTTCVVVGGLKSSKMFSFNAQE